MKRLFSIVIFSALVFAAPANDAFAAKVIKLAILPPEGSTWWKEIKAASTRLRELTNDGLKFRIYAGGVAGDEVDVVRKMRLGQLQGAGITSVGLAEIQPALLVLQAPGLFQSWEELDYVRDKLKSRFAGLLEEKGAKALLWGDVGFNRIFSNQAVTSPEQVSKLKPWCWTQDPVYRGYYKTLGVKPVLTSVPEVLPGLQTGLIDSFSSPPLVALSFQWFRRTSHMLDYKQSVTIGAIVLSKEFFDGLTDDEKAAVAQVSKEFSPRIAKSVRRDNRRSIKALKKNGVTVLEADATAKKAWQAKSDAAANALAGEIYPAELLKEVREAVKAYRSGRK